MTDERITLYFIRYLWVTAISDPYWLSDLYLPSQKCFLCFCSKESSYIFGVYILLVIDWAHSCQSLAFMSPQAIKILFFFKHWLLRRAEDISIVEVEKYWQKWIVLHSSWSISALDKELLGNPCGLRWTFILWFLYTLQISYFYLLWHHLCLHRVDLVRQWFFLVFRWALWIILFPNSA